VWLGDSTIANFELRIRISPNDSRLRSPNNAYVFNNSRTGRKFMANPLEQPVVAPPAAKPEHNWQDSIAETWHAGLRMVGLESEPKHLEPQHLEIKKFDFSKFEPELKRAAYIEDIRSMPMSEHCREELYSKALNTHLDISCISDVIKHPHPTDKK
jgi:hypothetical protein